MYKLKITPAAAGDLAEISAYISMQLHNPQAALQQNPHLGFSVSSKIGRETNLRALLSGNYFLFYCVENETIQISRVLDGRQDYLRVLFRTEEEK